MIPRNLGKREAKFPTLRGRANYPRLSAWVTQPREIETAAEGLASSLRAFTASSARTGVVVLLSDGLDPEIPLALRGLGGRGHEVLFLQILSQPEMDPELEGDLRLIDVESNRTTEITANSYALKEYRRRLAEHNKAIADSILRIGGRYALVQSDVTVEKVLQSVWKREGWVR